METKDAKILIISNNPLSLSNSNGRTLYNLVSSYRKDQLYNLFINGNDLLLDKINYYQISDNDVIHSYLNKKQIGKEIKKEIKIDDNQSISYSKKKTITKVNIRDFLWSKKRIKKDILKWVRSFNPNVILFQCGDTIFLMKLAMYIANTLDIPVITYNSEEYFFKDFNYIKRSFKMDHKYKKWHLKYQIAFNRLMSISTHNIYLTDELNKRYEEIFPYQKGLTLYNATEVRQNNDINNSSKDFVYSGNLGVGRLDTLIKIGKIIKNIDPSYDLKIYSKVGDNETLDILESNKKYISYCGFVSYEKNIEIIQNAFAIIHVDSFDNFYLRDCKYAFSTKIADSLATGNCFIAFVPKDSSILNYLLDNQCAYVFNEYESLKKEIGEIIKNHSKRFKYRKAALDIVRKNHSLKINQSLFDEKLFEAINRPFLQVLVTTINKTEEEMVELAKWMHIDSDAIIRNQNGTTSDKTIDFNGHKLRLVCGNDKGLSKNRNELFNISNSKYIWFLDDDIKFFDGYFKFLSEYFKEKNPDVLGISYSFFKGKKWFFKNKNYVRKFNSCGKVSWNLIFSGFSFKKNNLYFDERFGAGTEIYCGEDSIMKNRISKLEFHSCNKELITCYNLNSTWQEGETKRYQIARGFLYGYIKPYFYLFYDLRILLKTKEKLCSFSELIASSKKGRKLYLDDKKKRKCYYK